MTDEQKEFIKYADSHGAFFAGSPGMTFKGKSIKEIFPEAFEPELVDFGWFSTIYYNDMTIERANLAAKKINVPQYHGIYIRGDIKNPKITESMNGWVLTFEKK